MSTSNDPIAPHAANARREGESNGGTPARILVVDDDADLRDLFQIGLAEKGLDAHVVASADEAIARLTAERFDAVISDVRLTGMDGIELAGRIRANWPDVPVLVVTAYGSIESAVAAMRAGAYDVITKPIDFDALELSLRRALEHMGLRQEVRRLRQSLADVEKFDEFIGESAEMVRLYDLLARVASVDSSVLIMGETGTGKGLTAKVLHRRSPRAKGPFVVVNCAALPPTLLESEIFGHEKGSFTDAKDKRTGLFVEANGGTIFLDEIGTLPLELQPKLLRALEDRAVRPIGSNTEIPFDARVIAATNANLEAAVEEGHFRQDLFFRLNVIQVSLPPLRARGNDVLLLAQRFLQRMANESERRVVGMTQDVAEKLLDYGWPGNVRELHNCIERAVALTRYERLTVEDLPDRIKQCERTQTVMEVDRPSEWLPVEEVERRYVLRVLAAMGGNRSEAARVLGFDRRTLYRKLERYGAKESGAKESQNGAARA